MGITHTVDASGIAEVVMENPPVNALTVPGWFDVAAAHDDGRPGGGEPVGDASPDAPGPSGDEHDAAGHVERFDHVG